MKKSLTILLVLLVFLSSINSRAQTSNPIDSLRSLYQNEILIFSHGRLSKGENGERIAYNEMQNEFMFSPEGMKEMMLYKKAQGISRALLITSTASTVVGVSLYRNNKDLGLTFVTSSIILNGINLFIKKHAREKIEHAVWLRNRDLLFKK